MRVQKCMLAERERFGLRCEANASGERSRVSPLCLLNDGFFMAEEQCLCPVSDLLNLALTHGKLKSL